MTPGPSHRHRFARRGLTLLTAGLAVAACGSGGGRFESRAPDFSITTAESAAATGSRSYRASAGADVLWGLSGPTTEASASAVFPLQVSANGRYVVDQRGTPWRVQADAAWLMSSEATPDEVDAYLDQRQVLGFNSFYLMAAVHPGGYAAAHHAPNNVNGDPPFATPGDFSTAGTSPESERYWEWIDSIIAKAAERDMAVMFAYSYLGVYGGDQGWYQDVLAQPDVQSLYQWGQWLGERYRDRTNLVWFALGDFAPPPGSDGAARLRAIIDGIKDAGADQLFMAEANNPADIPVAHPDIGPVLDMDSFYGYGPTGTGTVYETAREAWQNVPTKPAWMQEGTYEFENNTGHFSGESWDTRRGRFWSVLAGGTAGDGFGSRQVWQWEDIPASLDTPGATESSYAFAFFASMPWWELEPSGTDPGLTGVDLVTGGVGTWGELDYITAARTTDHHWVVAYVPVTGQGSRTFTVDMSALAGPARARWFDPATGNYIAAGDALANEGSHDFTTPGSRGDGTDDWVLVLDVGGASPCGSITTDGEYDPPASAPAAGCEVTAAEAGEPDVIARAEVTAGSVP